DDCKLSCLLRFADGRVRRVDTLALGPNAQVAALVSQLGSGSDLPADRRNLYADRRGILRRRLARADGPDVDLGHRRVYLKGRAATSGRCDYRLALPDDGLAADPRLASDAGGSAERIALFDAGRRHLLHVRFAAVDERSPSPVS